MSSYGWEILIALGTSVTIWQSNDENDEHLPFSQAKTKNFLTGRLAMTPPYLLMLIYCTIVTLRDMRYIEVSSEFSTVARYFTQTCCLISPRTFMKCLNGERFKSGGTPHFQSFLERSFCHFTWMMKVKMARDAVGAYRQCATNSDYWIVVKWIAIVRSVRSAVMEI